MKIHTSSECKEILDKFDAFELDLRGQVEMKVRRDEGLYRYFWITKIIEIHRCYCCICKNRSYKIMFRNQMYIRLLFNDSMHTSFAQAAL